MAFKLRKIYPISAPVRRDLKKVEKRLLKVLDEAPKNIRESTRQVLKAGGKRLRPVLVLLAAGAGDHFGDDVIDGAIAVELIHMASLIHDDILDGADTRRGYPTVNATHGYKLAVAAGDYLFGAAFQLLACHDDNSLLAPLCEASMALSLGELLERDTAHQVRQDSEDYLTRVDCKTASLFKAACQVGAAIGRVPDGDKERLSDYGYNLGMAFQIYDDILDISGNESELGKPVGSDLKEGIVTLPMLFALERSGSDILKEAITSPNDDNVKQALFFLFSTDALSRAKDVARNYLDLAMEAIQPMRASEIKKNLISIGEFVIDRYQ